MKKTFTLLLILMVSFAFAQRGTVSLVSQSDDKNVQLKPAEAVEKVHFRSAEKDSDVLLPGNWSAATGVGAYGWTDGPGGPSLGWIFGNNAFEDAGAGQKFIVSDPYLIAGAYFWVGYIDPEATGDVLFGIWDLDNGVGDVIASVSIPVGDITVLSTEGATPDDYMNAFYVAFDSPVEVTGDYLIGVDLSDLPLWEEPGDGFGMVTSLVGMGGGMNLSWIKTSEGWTEATNVNAALDMDVAIFPHVADDDDPVDTYAVTFNVDMTDAVAEGDVVFDPDIHHVFITGEMTGWTTPGEDDAYELHPVNGAKGTSTTLYEEHFAPALETGALPEGWEQKKADNALGNDLQDLEEDDQRWWRYSELYDMGYPNFYPEWILTEDASMHINWNVEAEQNVYAITPAIELSPADEITLEFWKYFSGAWYTELDVLLELDGSWEVLAEYNSSDHENLYDEAVLIDLTDKVGTARIAFVYKWTDGIQMNIDAIKVTATDYDDPPPPEELFYTITLDIEEGVYEYKYFLVEDEPTWGLGEWAGEINRTITVDADMEVNDTWGVLDDDPIDQSDIVGNWKVYEGEGGLWVGPPDDGPYGETTWWQTDPDIVEERPCYFDDRYVFHADGTFENVLGDETWLEGWQTGEDQGCGEPVPPHDGSADATWEIDGDELTISGVGAYLGLPKAINGAEIDDPADAPEEITYQILSLDENTLIVYLDVGGAIWAYTFLKVEDVDDVVHELPFIEHFEGLEEDTPSTWLPEGWLNIDADGDGNSWLWNDYEDEEVYETYMISYSWFDGTPYTPDNWLITPAIEFGEVEEDEIIELMFHIATIAEQAEFRAERYEVLISTTDNDPESFTMIWEEVLPEDKDWFEWLERKADLSAYAGETVYLAFRHYGTSDLFGIALERVEVKVVEEDEEVDLFVYTDFEENQNVTFDGWPNVPVIIANPDVSEGNPSDFVAEWERSAEQWAHVWVDLDGPINFSTAQEFRLKVWSPIECEILFKLENQADAGIYVEVPAMVPVAEEWVELVFDFGDAESGLYDKIVIFFDFTATTDNTFYFDDVAGPPYDEPGEEHTYSIAMLIPADDYQYKYFVVVDDPTWELGEWTGDPNRSVTVDADMTIEDEWGVEPEKDDKFGYKGDALYNVTFKVTIEEGTHVGDIAFDPADHHIFIAGSFPDAFGWFWNEPGSNPLLELTIGDDDPINLSTPDISAPEAAVNIFPNPARNFVSIQSGENILDVTINDITGRTVKHMTVNAPEVTLNTSELINGFYLVNIYTESGVTVGKLQIQR